MTLRFRSLLIAALLCLFVAGFGGIWPIQAASALGLGSLKTVSSESSHPAGVDVELIPPTAMFVPRQAPLAASLLTSPSDLSGLRTRLALSGREAKADWESFQNSFLAEANLEYGRDVKPWLGQDLTLAVTTLDLDRDATNGQQPGYLLALAVEDSQRAREFLQRYWQRGAADDSVLRYERVSGVRLIYREPGDSKLNEGGSDVGSELATGPQSLGADADVLATTSALVGDRFILFSNSPKVIRDAVANVQVPELNLASDTNYQRSLAALTSPRLGFAYANLETLGGWLETQGLAVNRPAIARSGDVENDEALVGATAPYYQALAVGLGTTARGIMADTALLSPPQTTDESEMIDDSEERIEPARVLSYLPPESIAAVSSAHLNQVWHGIQPLLSTYPAFNTLVDRALDHVQTDWNLDITQEIFPWVKGEYGLGQLERPQGTDWVFVVERTSEDAQRGIEHLDELARRQGYSIGEVSLEDREVTAWTSLNPEGQQDSAASAVRALVRGVHAQMGNYELFSTSLEAMERVLQSRESEALTETKGFKQAIAPLPDSNQGYLYVNWQDNQAIIEEQLPLLRILDLTAQPLFRNLKTLSLSGYESQPSEGIQRVAIAFQLGK